MNSDYTVGTDPECFYTEEDGQVLPCGVVFTQCGCGTTIATGAGNLYVDGASLELQPHPGSSDEVIEYTKELLKIAKEIGDAQNTSIKIVPEIGINLDWAKLDHRLAIFGCDPDKSAWGESCTPQTINASEHPWRYAGCHIHVGKIGDVNYFKDTIELMSKMLDRTVGLMSMAMAEDIDIRRRGIYGRPGIYRHQPHGMEYRTPSNVILTSPEALKYSFELTLTTVAMVDNGDGRFLSDLVPDDLLLETMRFGNAAVAKQIYDMISSSIDIDNMPGRSTNWQSSWEVI